MIFQIREFAENYFSILLPNIQTWKIVKRRISMDLKGNTWKSQIVVLVLVLCLEQNDTILCVFDLFSRVEQLPIYFSINQIHVRVLDFRSSFQLRSSQKPKPPTQFRYSLFSPYFNS